MSRPIRYVDTGAGQIAYSVVGSGPPLVFDLGWIGHLETLWDHPGYRGLIAHLAESHRVVCFDPPGTGLSERGRASGSIEEEAAVLAKVLAASAGGSRDPVSLFSCSIGVSTALLLAARRPELVGRLVLFGGALRGEDLAGPDARGAIVDLVRGHWGLGARALAEIFVPAADSDERAWFFDWLRATTDGETAAQRLEMYYATDVSSEAAAVKAPTLVLHRTGDRAVPLSHGAAIAAAVEEGTLEPVDGSAHLCFLQDWQQIADLAVEFLRRRSARMLPKGPYGEFTARENDVAELATLGLTNAAIGERLGISARTVESHLAQVRAKLGVRTRAEVAAWMARRSEIG